MVIIDKYQCGYNISIRHHHKTKRPMRIAINTRTDRSDLKKDIMPVNDAAIAEAHATSIGIVSNRLSKNPSPPFWLNNEVIIKKMLRQTAKVTIK